MKSWSTDNLRHVSYDDRSSRYFGVFSPPKRKLPSHALSSMCLVVVILNIGVWFLPSWSKAILSHFTVEISSYLLQRDSESRKTSGSVDIVRGLADQNQCFSDRDPVHFYP